MWGYMCSENHWQIFAIFIHLSNTRYLPSDQRFQSSMSKRVLVWSIYYSTTGSQGTTSMQVTRIGCARQMHFDCGSDYFSELTASLLLWMYQLAQISVCLNWSAMNGNKLFQQTLYVFMQCWAFGLATCEALIKNKLLRFCHCLKIEIFTLYLSIRLSVCLSVSEGTKWCVFG